MRHLFTVLALVFTVLSTPVRAEIVLKLSVEPESNLPAIAPTLHVTATNNGNTPAALPNRVALLVYPVNGPSFAAYSAFRGDDRMDNFEEITDSEIVLAPKETRDLTFWASPDGPAWFAGESRLYSTGVYRLKLLVDAKLHSRFLADEPLPTAFPELANPIFSNEAVFTVRKPEGVDAEVWQLIRKRWSGWVDELANVIWNKYPSSRYAAYCIRKVAPSTPEQEMGFFRDALARNPDPSMGDWYRYNIARNQLQVARNFERQEDVDAAVREYDAVRRELEYLAKSAHQPKLRGLAQAYLPQAHTREDVLEQIEIDHGRGKLSPEVCLEEGLNGQLIARFLYENPRRDAISVPIGVDNKFTPPPFDRGQPTTFEPGHNGHDAVRIVLDTPEIIWHLQKKDVRANRDTLRCPKWLNETNMN